MNRQTTSRMITLALLLLTVALFFVFDLGRYLSLETLRTGQTDLTRYVTAHPVSTALGYLAIYIAVTALSLPGATIMTLAGGAVFGLWEGVLLISFASSIGATLACAVSRFLLRGAIQKRFGEKLRAVNDGIEHDGPFYLFGLRLVPVFPFFVINLVMGLTPMPLRTFYWVSQIGMFPATVVYVNAGTRLGQLESPSGILSPELLISFAILGLFPLAARKFLGFLKARKIYTRFNRPRRFDYNLMVIGGGSAGLVSAYIAAAVKAKVALVEEDRMGGDCLNTGCVPSKSLIRAAKLAHDFTRAAEFGVLTKDRPTVDFARVMEQIQERVKAVAPHDSVERYRSLGVDCLKGRGRITSPYTVEVDGKEYCTRSIIVATGARPFVPPIKGLDTVDYHTSDSIWSLHTHPGRLAILGGGPIGCELAQAFARLGADVVLVEMGERILPREDVEVSDLLAATLRRERVEIRTGHQVVEVFRDAGQPSLRCSAAEQEVIIPFDTLLIAVGRTPNVRGFGLEELGVTLTDRGTIATDPFLQTNYPNILCAGDVAGPYQFTHTASHQAWYAAVNALFAPLKRFRVDYSIIPWCTFVDPEVARVGLNETEAQTRGIPVEVTRYDLADLDRAITEGEAKGFIKILTPPGKDRILGVTIVGLHAGDTIAEFVLAMKQGIGLNRILGTIHIYPTFAEGNKMVAGVWKRAHAPERLLRWVERFHSWRRS